MVNTTEWHKAFVMKVQELTGCSHEEAFAVLGVVIDIKEASSQQGFQRGYDSAYKEIGEKKITPSPP